MKTERGNDMRVNNVTDWCRALDANDRQYGVANLAICDQTALLGYLQRHSHLLPQWAGEVFANVERYDRYDQLGLVMRFYQCNPTYYVDHVVASGALEAPAALIGTYHTTDEILKRLKGAPPPTNYRFAVGEPADGSWSKAIAMLREKIGLSPEGGYDMEAAEKLYQYGRNRWRTGRGYLYSDNNPEVLFDAGYKEYVTVVNSEVWVLAEMDINYLHDNEHEIWNKIIPEVLDLNKRLAEKDEYQGDVKATLKRMLYANPEAFEKIINSPDPELGLSENNKFFLKTISDGTQRAIWAAGAEVGYGLGTDLTWYLLTHSLADNPNDVIIEENVNYFFDEIIEKIKNNDYFVKKINKALIRKRVSFPKEEVKDFNFRYAGDFDLKSAINKCGLFVAGDLNEDGTWNLEIEMTDTYDFTEHENIFIGSRWVEDEQSGKKHKEWYIRSKGDMFAWAANNAAHFSQETGAIHPFELKICFTMENFEVKREWLTGEDWENILDGLSQQLSGDQ
ncbi:MAG: hypothetical protein HFI72_00540 [Peptococcaceae bacterium]|nr:hypothetical protein [Peptococcaceae bacterium]